MTIACPDPGVAEPFCALASQLSDKVMCIVEDRWFFHCTDREEKWMASLVHKSDPSLRRKKVVGMQTISAPYLESYIDLLTSYLDFLGDKKARK